MPSSSGSAELVISRERSWTGSLLPWAVLVDGQKLGTVANGGSLTVPTAPGHHTVVVSPPTVVARSVAQSQPFAFDAEAGGRIELVTKAPALGRPRIWRRGTPPSRSGLADLVGRTTARRAEEPFPDAPVSPPAATRPATTANPAAVTSCTIVEGDRYAVPLGGETRTIDNSKSTSATMRVVRLTREWARTYIVDAEQATTVQRVRRARGRRPRAEGRGAAHPEQEIFDHDRGAGDLRRRGHPQHRRTYQERGRVLVEGDPAGRRGARRGGWL